MLLSSDFELPDLEPESELPEDESSFFLECPLELVLLEELLEEDFLESLSFESLDFDPFLGDDDEDDDEPGDDEPDELVESSELDFEDE